MRNYLTSFQIQPNVTDKADDIILIHKKHICSEVTFLRLHNELHKLIIIRAQGSLLQASLLAVRSQLLLLHSSLSFYSYLLALS